MILSAPRFSPAGLRHLRSGFFGVALLLAIATPMGPVAAETYKPSTTLIHRIVTVQVNADGTATLTHDVARRADTPRGVSILGEEKLHFRETMTRMRVAKDSPTNARRFVGRLMEQCSRIGQSPLGYTSREDLAPGLRMAPIGPNGFSVNAA